MHYITIHITTLQEFFLVTIRKLNYNSRLSMNCVASLRTVKSWLRMTICGRSPTVSVVRYDLALVADRIKNLIPGRFSNIKKVG